VKRLTTETGAGQWGTALSEACAAFGLELTVFMVKGSYNQKPYRKDVMRTFGAKVIASPSDTTSAGRAILERDPDTTGSLGCAISEAVERAVTSEDCRYVLGSVLNQVLLHQSVIGLESYEAMKVFGEYPDVVIGCAGGGSNLGGLLAPFMRDKLTGARPDTRFVAVEPASCPSLTRGRYEYDFCDTGKITPMAKMYTLGSGFIPSPNHAGGLRYHGMSPLVSQAIVEGLVTPRAYNQLNCYAAAMRWAGTEGMICAPETSHAIACVIEEAERAREEGKEKVILFNYSGHGLMDLTGYDRYLSGQLSDYVLPEAALQESVENLTRLPKPATRRPGNR